MEAAPDTILIFVKSGFLGRKREQEDAIEIIVTGRREKTGSEGAREQGSKGARELGS
jgi:hypothetical protein